MQLKDNVKLEGLHIAFRRALGVIESIYKDAGQELVITCTTGGVHSPTSLHPYGRAIDIRTHYFTDNVKRRVLQELKHRLGCLFDVVWHSTHIHIELDI